MWTSQEFSECDNRSFEIFKSEMLYKDNNLKIEKTEDKAHYDAVVNDDIAVEIKVRSVPYSKVKGDFGNAVLLNTKKINYLRELKGFKKIYIAYILKDAYFLIDFNNMDIIRTTDLQVMDPGHGMVTEHVAVINVANETVYARHYIG